MKRIFNIVFLLICPFALLAQWKTTEINENLLINSDVIVRQYATDITFEDTNSISISEFLVVTILNEEGKNSFNLSNLLILNARDIIPRRLLFYDTNGNILKRLKKDQLQNINKLKNMFSILNDNDRIDVKYPFTLEFEYKMKIDSISRNFSWKPLLMENQAVENASCRVNFSDDFDLKYVSSNMPSPITEIDGNFIQYIWELKSISPFRKNVSSDDNIFPSLEIIGLEKKE